MSQASFMHGGSHRGLLGIKDGTHVIPGLLIKLYDIGEEGVVGALYPDKARQVQPLSWQNKDVIHAYHSKQYKQEQQASARPKLFKPEPERPRLAPKVISKPKLLLRPDQKPKLKPRP